MGKNVSNLDFKAQLIDGVKANSQVDEITGEVKAVLCFIFL